MATKRKPRPATNTHLPIALAAKIASALVACERALSAEGNAALADTAGTLVQDPEVQYWIDEMKEQDLVQLYDIDQPGAHT